MVFVFEVGPSSLHGNLLQFVFILVAYQNQSASNICGLTIKERGFLNVLILKKFTYCVKVGLSNYSTIINI